MSALSPPGTKKGRTQRVVLDLLEEHARAGTLPTSARFVFYELEQRGDARKPDPDDARRNRRRSHGWPPGSQDITDALTHLRDHGIIDWDAIVDEQRRVQVWMHAPTVLGYLADRLPQARINPWDGPPPLVLCESRATAGVLERATVDYVCPVSGLAGQSAGFLRTKVAPLFDGDGSRPILYLGDLDRSGNDIEANARRVLEDEIGKRAALVAGDDTYIDAQLDWTHLAMTEELAAAYDITPILKKDGRDGEWHEAVEVESLGQAELVALLRFEFDERLPEPLDSVLEREAHERGRVTEAWEHLHGDEEDQ